MSTRLTHELSPRQFEIPGFRVFVTPLLHRTKIPESLHIREFEASQVPGFRKSWIPCSWKTWFENFVKLNVSRVTGFSEFPNTNYLIDFRTNQVQKQIQNLWVHRHSNISLLNLIKCLNMSLVGTSNETIFYNSSNKLVLYNFLLLIQISWSIVGCSLFVIFMSLHLSNIPHHSCKIGSREKNECVPFQLE
jgi:hypothetical protein